MTRAICLSTVLLATIFGIANSIAFQDVEDVEPSLVRKENNNEKEWFSRYIDMLGSTKLKRCSKTIEPPTDRSGTFCKVIETGEDYVCLFGEQNCEGSALTHPDVKCDCISGRWSCAKFNACPSQKDSNPKESEEPEESDSRVLLGKRSGRKGPGNKIGKKSKKSKAQKKRSKIRRHTRHARRRGRNSRVRNGRNGRGRNGGRRNGGRRNGGRRNGGRRNGGRRKGGRRKGRAGRRGNGRGGRGNGGKKPQKPKPLKPRPDNSVPTTPDEKKWAYLVGKDCETVAKPAIKDDPQVNEVECVLENSPLTLDFGFKRVRIIMNTQGRVTQTPRFG